MAHDEIGLEALELAGGKLQLKYWPLVMAQMRSADVDGNGRVSAAELVSSFAQLVEREKAQQKAAMMHRRVLYVVGSALLVVCVAVAAILIGNFFLSYKAAEEVALIHKELSMEGSQGGLFDGEAAPLTGKNGGQPTPAATGAVHHSAGLGELFNLSDTDLGRVKHITVHPTVTHRYTFAVAAFSVMTNATTGWRTEVIFYPHLSPAPSVMQSLHLTADAAWMQTAAGNTPLLNEDEVDGMPSPNFTLTRRQGRRQVGRGIVPPAGAAEVLSAALKYSGNGAWDDVNRVFVIQRRTELLGLGGTLRRLGHTALLVRTNAGWYYIIEYGVEKYPATSPRQVLVTRVPSSYVSDTAPPKDPRPQFVWRSKAPPPPPHTPPRLLLSPFCFFSPRAANGRVDAGVEDEDRHSDRVLQQVQQRAVLPRLHAQQPHGAGVRAQEHGHRRVVPLQAEGLLRGAVCLGHHEARRRRLLLPLQLGGGALAPPSRSRGSAFVPRIPAPPPGPQVNERPPPCLLPSPCVGRRSTVRRGLTHPAHEL